jgi:putative hydrolase of the HAD superfamily
MLNAVMFDFSGTLFRVEPTAHWLTATLERLGIELPEAEAAACAQRLEQAGALPGGAPPQRIPEHLRQLWRERDLDAARHRAAYTSLAALAGLPHPALHDALYDRHLEPEAWHPYPDTEATLKELRRRHVPVAVVSNIGWDLRPVFRHHGVDQLVNAFVLSYEHGAQKPDPALFQLACTALGRRPDQVLMVGDDPVADGGATALGCAFHQVDHRPADKRPDALAAVLDLIG